MKPVISSDIVSLSQNDPELTLFESQYVTPDGMSYNSYLIRDEHIAILDTSDARTLEAWKTDLKSALAGRTPDYLVVHHLEPDHSAGIADVVALYPNITIVCSAKAAQMMPLFQSSSSSRFNVQIVKEGDVLCLGKHTLHFYMAPMVHWPEVMMSYDETDRVLFSADAFGKFGVMEAEPDDWACEARRYYFNICGKYGAPVSAVLRKLGSLDIQTICPLHGPVLNDGKAGEVGYNSLSDALRLYGIWSQYGVEAEGVFIAYASIHGCTAEAAQKLKEILLQKGCKKVSIMDICRSDIAEAVEDAFKYGRIVLAASSYDAGLFPPMYDLLHHLQIKGWQGRKVAVVENGSWAPSAGKTMIAMLCEMKDIEVRGELVTLRGRMKQTDIPALEALADAILA